MKRKTGAIAGVSAAVVIAGVVAAVLLVPRLQAPAEPQTDKPPQTAEVTRGDLREQVRSTGTLGYGTASSLGTRLPGTVTAVPSPRTVIAPGSALFSVDERPVILFTGALPVWREFVTGMTNGQDVKQLEENLKAFGYFSGQPDQSFRSDTAAAIKKWQQAAGLDKTGAVEFGRIVFAPGPLRVATVEAQPGAGASESVLTVTGTGHSVTAYVEQSLAGLATVGSPVDLMLPDGTQTTGVVSAVAPPVERDSSTGGKTMQVPLTITLDDAAAGADYDQATVTVLLTRPLAEDVLIVPVLALLAQPDGGFAVEKVRGDKVITVPVTLGATTSGQAQVEGEGLKAGDKVVVGQ